MIYNNALIKFRVKTFHSVVEEKVVKTAPEFTTQLEDVVTTDGGSARFECVVKGEPVPTVTWLKDSTPVEEAEEFQIKFEDGVSSLNIPDVYPEDAGKYTVVAKNELGTAMSTAELTVEGKASERNTLDYLCF